MYWSEAAVVVNIAELEDDIIAEEDGNEVKYDDEEGREVIIDTDEGGLVM